MYSFTSHRRNYELIRITYTIMAKYRLLMITKQQKIGIQNLNYVH